MKYTFKYTKYEFKYPKLIDKFEYYRLKNELENNPKYKFYRSESFFETFKFELITIICGIICINISMLSIPEWLEFILIMIVFMSLGILITFILSLFTYIEFIRDRSKYFSKLKKAIVKSENYIDFSNNYRI